MRAFSVHSKSRRPVSLQVFLPLLFLPVLLTGQTALRQIPLTNWAAPLYWQPNQAEREIATSTELGIRPMVTAISTAALTFVAITPCRLVDTRGSAAGFDGSTPFSGPSLAPSSTTTFPVQSSTEAMTTAPTPCGTIPSTAQAYSFNITVVPKTSGGVAFITVWPNGSAQPAVSTINDGTNLVLANAAIVPAGTPSGGINVINSGPATADLIIDMNGYYASPAGNINFSGALEYSGSTVLQLPGGASTNNIGLGLSALASSGVGSFNTAVGDNSLQSNTGGYYNTAMGTTALQNNTNGNDNTAFGYAALQDNVVAGGNTAIGFEALQLNNQNNSPTLGTLNTAVGAQTLTSNVTGSSNTAIGNNALTLNTSGANNSAFGTQALENNLVGSFNIAMGNAAGEFFTGNNNIAIGYQAAVSVNGGGNYNIEIGSAGSANDSGIIRIGTPGTQTQFFVAGVNGVTTTNNAVPVLIDATNGQLGVASSSRRYKEDIQDMGDASSALMDLRPVTYRYKQPFADGSKPVQYGLIAEEVAEVYPDLVAHTADGAVETVKYQVLDSMLLNEVQRQQAEIRGLEQQNRSLQERLEKLESALSSLAGAAPSVAPHVAAPVVP
jgi:Chaperone of endosialidase